MKLFKIGSSPACDIVINDPHVSSLHAEITILDNGEIVLEDKNSSNGTFVGNKKITPNSEVTVRRGDHVLLANVALPWGRIPTLQTSNGKYRQIVNIGSSFRNDLVINNNTVSRYHATIKIDKSGKAFICDNDSCNGTQVNGIKIQPNKLIRIKRGDNIMCAGEDITDQLAEYLPKSRMNIVWGAAIGVAVAAVVALAVFLIPKTKEDPTKYQPAIVYIHSAYHYEVSAGSLSFRYPFDEKDYIYATGTGFFVDRSGRIGTVRHVAVPWDEAYDKETHDQLKDMINTYIHSELRVANVATSTDAKILRQTGLGEYLWQNCNSIPELNAKLTSLISGNMTIEGKMDFFAVGYSGQNYESLSDFSRCTLIAESGDAKKDVALLQLNTKKTPDEIKDVFDLTKVTNEALKPMKEVLYTAGYPHGFQWNYGSEEKELKNSIRETKCSKAPSKYSFEFQATSQGGASGSPVYYKDGQLVGVLSAVYSTDNGPTIAAHAYFLKKLYEDNTSTIAK